MPTTDDDTDPNAHQTAARLAPDGHLEVPVNTARQGTRGSRRTMLVLTVSLGAAAAALGLYLAAQAPRLDAVDRQPGEVAATGAQVADPAVAATFDAPAQP